MTRHRFEPRRASRVEPYILVIALVVAICVGVLIVYVSSAGLR